MISRLWRALAKSDRAESYVEHLRADTLPALRVLPGFVSASILSRRFAEGVEFVVITQWRALEDVVAFSGADVEEAVVPPQVARMMIDYDRRARHYEVVG